MNEIKEFKVVCKRRNPDFSEVVAFLKEKKHSQDQIERTEVLFRDTGTVVATIKKVNPPGLDLAIIKLICYEGYKNYNEWNALGVFKLVYDQIIKKVFT